MWPDNRKSSGVVGTILILTLTFAVHGPHVLAHSITGEVISRELRPAFHNLHTSTPSTHHR